MWRVLDKLGFPWETLTITGSLPEPHDANKLPNSIGERHIYAESKYQTRRPSEDAEEAGSHSFTDE